MFQLAQIRLTFLNVCQVTFLGLVLLHNSEIILDKMYYALKPSLTIKLQLTTKPAKRSVMVLLSQCQLNGTASKCQMARFKINIILFSILPHLLLLLLLHNLFPMPQDPHELLKTHLPPYPPPRTCDRIHIIKKFSFNNL